MISFELTQDRVTRSRIIVVDDEPLVTTSLSSFLSLELEIEPTVFNQAPRAADYLREHEADLIISDFLMPEMDGIQLLKLAHQSQPDMPRILLTGYADKENAIRAINEVRVFQYLEKPWENQQLKNVILNALEKRLLMQALTHHAEKLTATQDDLTGLRRALVRAFA